MKLLLILLNVLFFTANDLQKMEQKPERSIEKNNLLFSWEMKDNRLFCTITAPTKGWVAIGFNTKEGLTGTNLIMGSVIGKDCQVSDRYVLRPGEHKSMEEMGGKSKLLHIDGSESNGKTTVHFSLPLQTTDKYHFDLVEGKEYHLLMAYSQDDDFKHHSIMRTSSKITL